MSPSKPNVYAIHGLTIVHCSDEKEIDFAEQLESVAYVLCGEGPITFEKFISIWNARGVSWTRSTFSYYINLTCQKLVFNLSILETIQNVEIHHTFE